jgi:hypothetical protein
VNSGPSTNTTRYTFLEQGDRLSFRFEFEHSVGPAHFPNDAISSGAFEFIPAQDVNYAVGGFYALSGAARIALNVHLVERVKPYPTMFQSAQESRWMPSQTLTIGQQHGDSVNILIGSPTGVLTAGNLYYFEYRGLLSNQTSQTASVSGSIQFTLTPEPRNALLLAMGIVLLMGRHPPAMLKARAYPDPNPLAIGAL